MAQHSFHGISDNWFAQLNADITDSATSIVLKGAGASTAVPSTPFYGVISAECVRVTVVASDTPSAGLSTLTVTRGEEGTSAAAHSEDDYMMNITQAVHVQELQRRLASLERAMLDYVGDTDGVLGADDATLKVVAQGTPDMTVSVGAGSCISASQPAGLTTATNSDTVVAPVSNPRIDVVEIACAAKTGLSAINIVTGTEAGSPSAPSVTSGALKLAEIYCRVGMTSIKDTDDSTNGYITDSRSFAQQ